MDETMKRYFWIAAILAAPLFLTGCNRPVLVIEEQEEETDDKPAEAIVLTKAESDINESVIAFGLDVFSRINKLDDTKDMFISPLSLSLALAMTSAGAKGQTEEQMRTMLGFGSVTNAEMAEYYRKMTEALLSIDPKTTVQIANAIWTDKGITLKKDFVSDVTKYYHSEANSADMSLRATINAINQWCANHTNNKITKILGEDDGGLAVLLINALYFNGTWREKFSETYQGKFKTLAGSGNPVTMMRTTRSMGYAATDKWRMVQLPYGNGAFVMDLLLPADEGKFQDAVRSLGAEDWSALTAALHSREVNLEFPKFKMEYEILLNDVLQSLGMTTAFTGHADFSRMSDTSMCIDFVKQKTYVDVNEEGTEAAAVTAVGMKATSVGPSEPIRFIANRPFVFAIREASTGALLFIGQKTK